VLKGLCAATLALAIVVLASPRARAQEANPAEAKAPPGPGFATSLPGLGGARLPDVGKVTATVPVAPGGGASASGARAASTPSAPPPADLGDSIRKPATGAGEHSGSVSAGTSAPGAVGSGEAATVIPKGGASSPGALVQAAVAPPAAKAKSRAPRGTGSTVATAPAADVAPPSAALKGSAGQSGPFSALQLSSGHGPIDIKSDTLELDYKNNSVLFSGHVRAVQADALLTSNSLKVLYGKDFHQVKEMFANGNVRMSQGTRWATGEHAVLNQVGHTVTLTGNPVVHDGPDQVTGTRIIVHLDSGKSEVIGARAVLFPKQGQTRDNGGASAGHRS
jgi:lipopolysaccharide export system protein LptA